MIAIQFGGRRIGRLREASHVVVGMECCPTGEDPGWGDDVASLQGHLSLIWLYIRVI